MVRSSSFTRGTRRVILVSNLVISHEWGKDRVVLTTVVHMRGRLWHRYSVTVNQIMAATVTIGTFDSVAFLLAATLYQENHDMNHNLWNIGSTEKYILIYRCWWNVATYKWEVHNGKIPHCRSRCEADLAVSVVSFISSSTGSTKSPNV
jgi:hypothetical protein